MKYFTKENKQKVLEYLQERDSDSDLMKEELQQVLNLEYPLFKVFLKEAKSKGFISEMTLETLGVKRTSLMVNPFHTSETKYIDVLDYRAFGTDNLFQESLKELDDEFLSWNLKRVLCNEYLLDDS